MRSVRSSLPLPGFAGSWSTADLRQPGERVGGIGVAELFENVVGRLPGTAGRLQITGRAVGIAERHQHLGFVNAVAGRPEQRESGPVAGYRPRVVAKVVVGVAEAVPGLAGTDLVAEPGLQLERFLAVRHSTQMVT